MDNITVIKDCKYRLPCGWCDRKKKMCQFEEAAAPFHLDGTPFGKEELDNKDISKHTTTIYELTNKLCTNHQWECSGADTAGWTYRCRRCGATKRENFQNIPYVNPVWINPDAPDINKVGDFPPYNHVTCTSGYVNSNKCPEATINEIIATDTTTIAQTISSEVSEQENFVAEVKSGKLPKMKEKK